MKTGDEMKEASSLIQQKVKIFLEKDIPVHVTMFNKTFYNGKVMGPFNSDYFMLEDIVLGEMPIFFVQVQDVEPQRKFREEK